MPTESVIILAAIVAAFAIFGVVLAWAEHQTHKHG
jgi:multisubunit Na+/H+ antiporter MnhC subunit